MAKYTMSIDAEGDYGNEIDADSEQHAAEQAESIIAGEGDFDIAAGEKITVRYWVTPEGAERGDSRELTIEG
jgi:hypothetical protein